MDYVITPEGSQFSCEHGVATLGFEQLCKFCCWKKIFQTFFFLEIRNLESSFGMNRSRFEENTCTVVFFLKLDRFPFI